MLHLTNWCSINVIKFSEKLLLLDLIYLRFCSLLHIENCFGSINTLNALNCRGFVASRPKLDGTRICNKSFICTIQPKRSLKFLLTTSGPQILKHLNRSRAEVPWKHHRSGGALKFIHHHRQENQSIIPRQTNLNPDKWSRSVSHQTKISMKVVRREMNEINYRRKKEPK